MSTFKTEINVDVTVHFTYSKGVKGTRDKFGVPQEPDDDPEVEVTSVKVGDVDVLESLPKPCVDSLVEEAWDEVREANDE